MEVKHISVLMLCSRLHWCVAQATSNREKYSAVFFSLGAIFFSSIMLLDACILGISDLIDLVMGRSEWHAGMERSARTHAFTHIYIVFSLAQSTSSKHT